jgi:hypothetical protein
MGFNPSRFVFDGAFPISNVGAASPVFAEAWPSLSASPKVVQRTSLRSHLPLYSLRQTVSSSVLNEFWSPI